jgi:ribosomal protein S18 acetylase RimI-like enzyme
MLLSSAEKTQSRAIARLIMNAMDYECCAYFVGKEHTLSDFEDVMTLLVEDENSQYSYLNTTVAITDDGEVAGICISYDGGDLHRLRKPFVKAMKKYFDSDFSNMVDETEVGELYIDSLAVVQNHRGNGIATALLKQAFDKTRKIGIDRVGLLVDNGNYKAEHLYTSLGFRLIGYSSWGGHVMKHLVKQVSNSIDNN